MPYTMTLHATGACRHINHDKDPSFAAAAVIMINKYEKLKIWTYQLPTTSSLTTQRAHLAAIILALEIALSKSQDLRRQPRTQMDVTIRTDSKYAFGCMTQWWRKWLRNGFKNYRGREIKDRDLVERALLLEREVLERARMVEWVCVTKREIEVAGKVVKGMLDKMEGRGEDEGDSDEPIWEAWEKESW